MKQSYIVFAWVMVGDYQLKPNTLSMNWKVVGMLKETRKLVRFMLDQYEALTIKPK
jgi:hypothetical protein